jgi:hypothetical protein
MHHGMRTLAFLLALGAGAATAAPLALGGQVSGLWNGDPQGLWGADSGYSPGPGSNTTTVSDLDIEFITASPGLQIDLDRSGRLTLWDDQGLGLLAGSHVLRLDFDALSAALGSVQWLDLSQLLGGRLDGVVIDPDSLELRLQDLQFSAPFGAIELQLHRVPEPATPGLVLGAALAAGALRRRR